MIPDYLSWKPTRTAIDLATLDRELSDLAVSARTKHLELIGEFHNASRLWCVKLNQQQFDTIACLATPRSLSIHGMPVGNLARLQDMVTLKELAIHCNSKAESLDGIEHLERLRVLRLFDFPKLRVLTALASLRSLEALDLMGGFSNGLRVHTLEPLGELQSLRSLSLQGIRVDDESLAPLWRLNHLETLVVSNQFPTEEYARLAVALPTVQCETLRPYIRLEKPIGGKDVLVVGKGKPYLDSSVDKARLEKYVAKFEELKAQFRSSRS